MSVAPYIRDSYRYLRLALVVVTLTLGISLVIEFFQAACLQGSISAFYYTPVHAVFIGVLFVIGVALVALRGRDDLEDMFFNLAGFLAPVVALVPTSRPIDLCGPTERHLTVPHAALVTNNAWSLFIAFAVAIVVAFFLAQEKKGPGDVAGAVRAGLFNLPRPVKVGLVLSAIVLIAGLVWYLAWNDSFERRAHGTAAVLMFVAIWFAVLINADFGLLRRPLTWLYGLLGANSPTDSRRGSYRLAYQVLAFVMLVAGVVGGIAVRAGVRHSVFWLEVAEIVPFALFWILQTREGWSRGTTTGPIEGDSPAGTAVN